MQFKDTSPEEIDNIMKAAKAVFPLYRNVAPQTKALFLEAIADNMEAAGDALILKASEETNIPPARLMGERARTTMQLRAFAEMLKEGSWIEASIDTGDPQRQPVPKPDLRKMLIPLGPVVVFGASNFPFAYSTAGGDTASALAAGCPVIVKAHPAHPETSEIVANAIHAAARKLGLPDAVFQHLHGAAFETGKLLVEHPATAAVGFTGSFQGGKALYDYAQQRKFPIPVFSEMGSVNPAVFFPGKLKESGDALAKAFASSITTGMGQFCTKPGLLFALDDEATNDFFALLQRYAKDATPARMLHKGIYTSFTKNAKKALTLAGVEVQEAETAEELANPAIVTVSGDTFLTNISLQEEVFGPFSLLVRCKDLIQMRAAWQTVAGQLTTSMIGNEEDFANNRQMIEEATDIAGRIVFNGVPTGVEVSASMVHGGPFPASTDGRFTAVGINAVKRWVRPVCFQNCPEFLLPDALKSDNPMKISRMVNNVWTRATL